MKKFLIKLTLLSGLHLILRAFIQKHRATVIYYHDISPEIFEQHVKYLLRHYNLISIDALTDYLYGKIDSLPAKSLLITFDDGHIGNYNLLEIAKKYKIRPVIFLTVNLIGSNEPFWFKLPFKTSDEKTHLKSIPDIERRDYLNKHYTQGYDKKERQSLNWDEVNQMAYYFDFHSHTLDHPCLPNCIEEVMNDEVRKSKLIIEEKINKKVFAITYPNGDYTQREIKEVKDAGYLLGFSSIPGFCDIKSNKYELKRLSVNDTNDLDEFVLRIIGTWYIFKKIKKIINYG